MFAPDIKEEAERRSGGICDGCGQNAQKTHIDHIIPVRFGGKSVIENAQVLCTEPCHRIKTQDEGSLFHAHLLLSDAERRVDPQSIIQCEKEVKYCEARCAFRILIQAGILRLNTLIRTQIAQLSPSEASGFASSEHWASIGELMELLNDMYLVRTFLDAELIELRREQRSHFTDLPNIEQLKADIRRKFAAKRGDANAQLIGIPDRKPPTEYVPPPKPSDAAIVLIANWKKLATNLTAQVDEFGKELAARKSLLDQLTVPTKSLTTDFKELKTQLVALRTPLTIAKLIYEQVNFEFQKNRRRGNSKNKKKTDPTNEESKKQSNPSSLNEQKMPQLQPTSSAAPAKTRKRRAPASKPTSTKRSRKQPNAASQQKEEKEQ